MWNPPSEASREDVEKAIHEWIIGRNAERNRAMLARKLFDGITFEALAEEFNLSRRQAWTIVNKCEQIIFRHLPK